MYKYTPNYSKPKIILIDFEEAVLKKVQYAGLNVLAGTFGSPYKVEMGDNYLPVIGNFNLPNYTEQEIIFIDLTKPSMLDALAGKKLVSEGTLDWWILCSSGFIDPRPRNMCFVREDFNRIYKHGGLFIIFAQPILYQKIIWAKKKGSTLHLGSKIKDDNWSFLQIFSLINFNIYSDYGKEINIIKHKNNQLDGLNKYVKNTEYTATFKISGSLEGNWTPFFVNKYGDCIGGIFSPQKSMGRIIILPQFQEKDEVVVTLLREILPEISPHLFPHVEGKWVEKDEYEFESVIEYKSEIIKIQKRVNEELVEINKKIEEEREKYGFLYGIITKTGDELVQDVYAYLKFIGFENVIDVDKEIENQKIEEDKEENKQEDLKILDKSPSLLLEVKGMSKCPRESDVLQVHKYVLRRIKEWNRTDVCGVSIINHQRNLPAHDRENKNVFSQAQLKDSKNYNTILVTTWDLFLLVKGILKWNWNPEVVRDLFYKPGRIPRIPTHYLPIGKVIKFWEQASSISLEIFKNNDIKIHKGQTIGYVIPDGYLQEEVVSLQIDTKDVDEAGYGDTVGIKTIYKKEQLKKGTPVFIVS